MKVYVDESPAGSGKTTRILKDIATRDGKFQSGSICRFLLITQIAKTVGGRHHFPRSVGGNMPLFNSSAIKRAEYDVGAMHLKLWFPDSGPYDFCRVPQHIYDGLLKAQSKGAYYNAHIRDRYQC